MTRTLFSHWSYDSGSLLPLLASDAAEGEAAVTAPSLDADILWRSSSALAVATLRLMLCSMPPRCGRSSWGKLEPSVAGAAEPW